MADTLAKEIRDHSQHQWSNRDFVQSEKVRSMMNRAANRIDAQDALLARAADLLNARPYNDDMVLGAEISDYRAKCQQ